MIGKERAPLPNQGTTLFPLLIVCLSFACRLLPKRERRGLPPFLPPFPFPLILPYPYPPYNPPFPRRKRALRLRSLRSLRRLHNCECAFQGGGGACAPLMLSGRFRLPGGLAGAAPCSGRTSIFSCCASGNRRLSGRYGSLRWAYRGSRPLHRQTRS